MSLDTVLKIGKALKKSDVRHFRHIAHPTYKFEDVTKLSIDLKENFSFDLDSLKVLTDENLINELSYLKFQTADKDTNPIKYLFGDIFYGIKKGNEKGAGGWYKTFHKRDKKTKEIDVKTSSFYEGKVYYDLIIEKIIAERKDLNLASLPLVKFHESFEAQKNEIENTLKFHKGIYEFLSGSDERKIQISQLLKDQNLLKLYQAKYAFNMIRAKTTNKSEFKKLIKVEEPVWAEIKEDKDIINKLNEVAEGQVFLHFKFPNKEHWYQQSKSVQLIIDQIYRENTTKLDNGYIFNKTLYPPLCSGDTSNDIQFPNFDNDAKFKSKLFSKDDLENLFYGFSLATKSIIRPYKGLDIRVLPNSRDKELLAEDYLKFCGNDLKGDEKRINQVSSDTLFPFELLEEDNNITTFDMVFTDTNGQAHVDLLEISGVEKSTLSYINNKIEKAKHQIYEERKKELFFLKNELPNLSIIWSFKNLLGVPVADEEKKTIKFTEGKGGSYFKTHLIKVLPKIYTKQYFEDRVLLPSFINNVEYSVRKGFNIQFHYLKYDFKFLLLLQKSLTNQDNMKRITTSISYEAGLQLGQLARQFSGDSTPISSFDKSFAGNVTRHISTLKELKKTKTSLEEKLARWELAKYTKAFSSDLANQINLLNEKTYDKHECAYGFFESYFKPNKKKSLLDKLQNLIGDYKSDKENEDLVENLELLLVQQQEN